MRFTDNRWKQVFSPQTVFLGKEFARELGLSEGQTLTVTSQGISHDLIVGGLLRSSDALLQGTERQAIMDIAAAQWLFGWLGRLHSIAVVPEPARGGGHAHPSLASRGASGYSNQSILATDGASGIDVEGLPV